MVQAIPTQSTPAWDPASSSNINPRIQGIRLDKRPAGVELGIGGLERAGLLLQPARHAVEGGGEARISGGVREKVARDLLRAVVDEPRAADLAALAVFLNRKDQLILEGLLRILKFL